MLIDAKELGGHVHFKIRYLIEVCRVLFTVVCPKLLRLLIVGAVPALEEVVRRHGDRPLAVLFDQVMRHGEPAVLEREPIVLEVVFHQIWEFSAQRQ